MSKRTLYLCYFGIREPLVQTQVLPYLRHLASQGIDVSLLTFEPRFKQSWGAEQLAAKTSELADSGIRWSPLPYHKRPSAPATLYDIFAGAWAAIRLVRRYRIDVLHARSHVPLAMALLARRWVDCSIVFDIRGLMAEEYADAGVWAENSLPFRLVKRLERAGIRHADQIVVLTQRMRSWLTEQKLAESSKVEVIPCCVDLSRFERAAGSDHSHTSDRFEVVYAGSVTGLYLLEEMGQFFLALRAREPRAFLRILTKSPAEEVARILSSVGLNESDFSVGAVGAEEVPAILHGARLGISFRKPTFSQIAASPTKIPEYLAAGLPVVSNAGIGDTDELLEGQGVGVVIREMNPQEFGTSAERALALAREPEIRERCQQVARERFDLARIGGARYGKVYQRINGELTPARGIVKARRLKE
jgi:glycosyltransferase involved in cell wall biosynthesis